jgi:hypothetical protein
LRKEDAPRDDFSRTLAFDDIWPGCSRRQAHSHDPRSPNVALNECGRLATHPLPSLEIMERSPALGSGRTADHSSMTFFRRALVAAPLFAASLFVLFSPASALADDSWWDSGWSVIGFGGVMTTNESSDIWLHDELKLTDDRLFGVGVSKRLVGITEDLDLEFEQQAVKHFEGQDNWEFNSVFMLRWKTFPWDSFIDTSFAAGDGLSIASETPKLESERYGNDESSALLNFVLVEFAFALPDYPGPELVMRMQHRSGAFGLINNTSDASTAFTWGIRYRF